MNTQGWLAGIAEVQTQVPVRHLLRAHRSSAALDLVLGHVRDFLAQAIALASA